MGCRGREGGREGGRESGHDFMRWQLWSGCIIRNPSEGG